VVPRRAEGEERFIADSGEIVAGGRPAVYDHFLIILLIVNR
jgi:hypothetical protein